MNAPSACVERPQYELRFGSLFNAGHAFAFPCDASGQVDLTRLPEAGRRSYRQVCESVGREFSLPDVQPSAARRSR